MGDHTRIFAQALSQVRRDHLERYVFAGTRTKGRVLDAACGCGYGGHVLKTAGCEVVGIDIEPDAIEYAKKYWPGAEYFEFDLNRDSLLDEFDCVVSFETLEHLSNPEHALKQFAKVSKNLICSVPNELQMPFSSMRIKDDKYPHRRHYTPNELDELLKSCGWSVKERHCQTSKTAPVTDGTNGIFLVYVCDAAKD